MTDENMSDICSFNRNSEIKVNEQKFNGVGPKDVYSLLIDIIEKGLHSESNF